MISTAIGTEIIARVVGYLLKKGNFQEGTPNLPMRLALFGQANTDKQSGLVTTVPYEFTSAADVGKKYGYGSQLHIMARILRSVYGDTVGGIPTVIYPQVAPAGGTAEVQTITVTGTASASGTIDIRLNGRTNIDGESLTVDVANSATATAVASAISDKINASVNAPVSASSAAGVVTLTCKWVGVSTTGLNVEVITGDDNLSMTYVVAQTVAGSGTSDTEISSSLALFGNVWNTVVINPYGKSANPLFEAVNGIAGSDPATGRYGADFWKPFVALTGDLVSDTVANVVASLDKEETTIAQCPAPNSKGWEFEAAANMATVLLRQAQDSPHLDTAGKFYPDMPTPDDDDAGVYATLNNRQSILTQGGSIVTIENSKYRIEALATTYHPDGENPAQFRFVRTLIQDFNVNFAYYLKEQLYVVDKMIAANDAVVGVTDVIKPDTWKGVVFALADDLEFRGIITDKAFMKENTEVGTSETNPDRMETNFSYKRSAFGRVISTTANAGFSFGS